ncbi:protein FAM53A-like [Brienomyrus brachyistius]|uniref:protein FAM53A-like n=1 Tax=Brienomyrus brachyistius TaxID=42636 RepID=UPI0020B1ACE4|nr:protein FAM53A-like [Brienomyrus brachyistius]
MLVGEQGDKGTGAVMTLIAEKLREPRLCDGPREPYGVSLRTEKLRQTLGQYPYESHVLMVPGSPALLPAEEKPWRSTDGSCSEQTGIASSSLTLPFGNGSGQSPSWPPPRPTPGTAMWSEAAGAVLLPGWISDLSLNDNGGSVLAPPTKRHCRSLSEPDELSRCRSPWKPGNSSKIWTPISKRRCNSGGVASLQYGGVHGSCGSAAAPPVYSSSSSSPPGGCGFFSVPCSAFAPAVSPVPRPSSASSGFVDCSGRSSGASSSSAPPWPAGRSPDLSPCRRFSLSQEHIPEAHGLPASSSSSSPASSPELGRHAGLLRCRSQPCVLQERKAGLKRPRENEARWSRPSLDFLKMTQTLKNSKSLCSLDDEDLHMRTIVSSPCGSADDLVNIITPGSSPVRELLEVSASQRGLDPQHDPLHLPPQRPGFRRAVVAGESDEDISDADSIEERIFPLYCGDLDLEQIEKN